MSGPPPKAGSARRRRNPTPGFRLLPHEGSLLPAPPWPLEGVPTPHELSKWAELWQLPQAVEWHRMHCADTVALYVRVFCEAALPGVDTKLVGEVRQLDALLGLSPKSMHALRWETDEPEVEEEAIAAGECTCPDPCTVHRKFEAD